jgi:hypothetical protein
LLAYKIINEIVRGEEQAEIIVKLIKNEDKEKELENKSKISNQFMKKQNTLIDEFFERSVFDYPEEVKGANFIPHINYMNKNFSQKINKFLEEGKFH